MSLFIVRWLSFRMQCRRISTHSLYAAGGRHLARNVMAVAPFISWTVTTIRRKNDYPLVLSNPVKAFRIGTRKSKIFVQSLSTFSKQRKPSRRLVLAVLSIVKRLQLTKKTITATVWLVTFQMTDWMLEWAARTMKSAKRFFVGS